jgi:copper transport protein
LRRPLVVALLAGLWLLASGPAAGAHALLRGSEPASGATLDRAPQAVVVTFTEPPDPRLSRLQVLDTQGRQASTGKVVPVPGEPHQLRVALAPGLPDGTYTVSWRTLSRTDGHVAAGAFAFGVGVQPGAVTAPQTGAVPATAPPNPLGVVGRWAFYCGLIVLVGAAATGLLVFGRRLPERSRPLLGAGLGLAAAGLAAVTLAKRADVDASFGELFATGTGQGLLREAAALAVTAVAVALLAARPRSPGRLALAGAAAAATMVAHVTTGHANGESSLRWLNLLMQSVHVVAVGVWIGGLVWLLAGVRGQERPGQVAAVKRFSVMAGLALAVVSVTGLARALGETGSWGRLLGTSFGRTLDLKVLLFLGLVALGAVNRRRIVPALASGAAQLGALRRTVRAEVGLAALVLLTTGLLAGLPPARSVVTAPKPAAPAEVRVSGNDYATSVLVDLVVAPGTAGPNRFRARVVDYDTREPFPARRVQLRFQLPSRPDLGASTLELARGSDDNWTGQGSPLSIDGRWSITTLVQGAGTAVTVPLELETRRPDLATATSQQVQVSRIPGQPTIYTFTIAGGRTIQSYIDPGKPGTNQVHATFFDPQGNEQPQASVRVTAAPASDAGSPRRASPAPDLKLLRLGPGHFAAQGRLGPGRWTFDISATARDGAQATARYEQVIEQ